MSVLNATAAKKPHNILKKQPILAKLYVLHAIYKRNIVKSFLLKRQNATLRAENKVLTEELALMEAQLLQLREVVALQTRQHMQLTKFIRDTNLPQKN